MTEEKNKEWMKKLKEEYEHLINDPMYQDEKKEELLEHLQIKTGKSKDELLEIIKRMA